MKYADSSRGRPFTKDPAVVSYNNRYWMYYSLPPFRDGRENDGWAIGIATGTDLDNWERCGVLLPEQQAERPGICAPATIVIGDTLHLFYQRYIGAIPSDAICHATSRDGITFQRNPANPILSARGDWNNGRAIDADVIVSDGKLLLYFATRDPENVVQKLGVASAPIDSDFSPDQWTQLCDSSILEPELEWEQDCIEAPAVCRYGDQFYMFYAGAYNNRPQQIGCAVSADGVRWERLSTEPFLTNGAKGEWNESESGHPYIFVDDDQRYHLFYQGNNDQGRTWYLSRIEIGWRDGVPYRIVS